MAAPHANHRAQRMPRSVILGFGALVATLAMLFAAALFADGDVVGAQAGPSPAGCSGDYVNGFGNVAFDTVIGNKLVSSSPTSATHTLGSAIPPGTYDLSAVSYDGYTGRENDPGQFSEQWFAQLLDASGNVLATSTTTGDLADGVAEATWAGGLGQVTVGGTVTQIRTVHAAIGSAAINSVRPVCVGASTVSIDPPPPATTNPPQEPDSDTSSITVVKTVEGTGSGEATISLECGEFGSALGSDSNPTVSVGDLPVGASCTVSIADIGAANIGFSVTPESIIPIAGGAANSISLVVPSGGLDIVVSVTCTIDEGGGAVDPDPTPPSTLAPSPPTTPAPQPVRQPADAQPADPVAADPSFTG